MSTVALGRWSRADSIKDGNAAGNRPQSSAATFVAADMSIRLRLLLEAPTAIHALEDRYVTGRIEEAIGVTISVALEEGHI